MGAWCCQEKRAENPILGRCQDIGYMPKAGRFSFHIDDVKVVLNLPSVMSRDTALDTLYVSSVETQEIVQNYGIYPEGYYMSVGDAIDLILITPKNRKHGQHIKITCRKLVFGILKKAIGYICETFYTSQPDSMNILKSKTELNHDSIKMKNILESKPSILRFDHKRTIIKVNRGEVMFADIRFNSKEKFQIENFTETNNYDLKFQKIQSFVTMISNSPKNVFKDAVAHETTRHRERRKTCMFDLKMRQQRRSSGSISPNNHLPPDPLIKTFGRKSAMAAFQTGKQKKTTMELIPFSPADLLSRMNSEWNHRPDREAIDEENMKDPVAKRLIINIGKTNYLSSVLIALSHVRCFSTYILHENWRKHSEVERHIMTSAYRNILRQLIMVSNDGVDMEGFYSVLAKSNQQYSNLDQQDAASCLNFILSTLHWELDVRTDRDKNKCTIGLTGEKAYKPEKAWKHYQTQQYSAVQQYFHGMFKVTQHCQEWENNTNRFEIFSMVSMDLKEGPQESIPLGELWKNIKRSTKTIEMFCQNCSAYTPTYIHKEVVKLPPILVIQLSRCPSDNTQEKCEILVDYPIKNMDMRTYLAIEAISKTTQYDLVSVICHKGNALYRNYWTLGKRKDKNWYMFAGNKIYRLEKSEALSKSAYVLIYQLRGFEK